MPRNIVPAGLERFTDEPLAPQPAVQRVSPSVICILGLNASSYTLNGTNT